MKTNLSTLENLLREGECELTPDPPIHSGSGKGGGGGNNSKGELI